jgi:hypothetical protein
MSPTPSPTNNQPPIHPIISMNNWWMRAFSVAILRTCFLGSHLCNGVIFLIILVSAGLSKAANAMVELCVLWQLCIKIKIGTSMSYKFLWYDTGNIRTIAASNSHTNSSIYRLVWATKLLLAAIGLVFPLLVLGYKSFNCSMYHVPVPMLIEKFVWIYFNQLFTVAGSIIFWHTNSRSLQSILYWFLCTFLNLNDYPSNS